MKRLALALGALAVATAALLAWTPAALVLPGLVPSAVSLQDVRGTLWHGRAGQVRWRGHALGTLHWDAAPSALLRAEFDLRLRLAGPMRASARLRVGPVRRWLEQARLELPARWLDGVLATPVLQPRGQIEIQLADARFERGQWHGVAGQARWKAAALTGVAAAPLGDLLADFSQVSPGRIEGRLRDVGGPLVLTGRFGVDARGYQAEAWLAARDPALLPALEWLGQSTATGRHLVLHGPLHVPAGGLATYQGEWPPVPPHGSPRLYPLPAN